MTMQRRRVLLGLAAGACGPAGAAPKPARCPAWPAWETFKQQFIGDGGRVAESATPRSQTVSEAQGYALFFALVAGERDTFERLLRWTEDNLAGGDLTVRLPAWQWGRRDDGRWGVIDDNPASDADLWIAYALGEAGRLWQERRYTALASLIADRVLREETAQLPGLGLTLLPGPQGFVLSPTRWRLNPSYVPLPLMRWLAARSAPGGWDAVLQSSLRLLRDSAPRGFAPEWAHYQADGGNGRFALAEQPADDRLGSYNAIRVYLWLGLIAPQDPARAALLAQYAPMAELIQRNGVPPEGVDAVSGQVQGAGPSGFSAAMLPFLKALSRPVALNQQLARLQARPLRANAYYEQALGLFGLGAHESRYRFDVDGSLLPGWNACTVSPSALSR
jgi:endoglucanase